MIDRDLLAILACPETHQPLEEAGSDLVLRVNEKIARGEVRNVGGAAVAQTVDGGLVRADGRIFYPIRQGIPVLLIDEGIPIG